MGDTLVVGAIRASPYGNIVSTRNGLVYVFARSGSSWGQQAKLAAPEAAGVDMFGMALALQRDRLVVGAPFEGSGARQSGAAYVFTRTGETWSAPVKLKAAEPATEAYLGWSVALDADTIVAGAHHDNQALITAGSSGSAHVFVLRDTSWMEQAHLQAPQPDAGDLFGWSVSVLGDRAVIGAPHGDVLNSSCKSGRAYVFDRSADAWQVTATLEPTTPRDCDYFGTSVALGDGSLVIGASGDAPSSDAHNSGAIYLYARADTLGATWTRTGFLKEAKPQRDAAYGKHVAMSGETLAVSAPYEDGLGMVHVLR